MIELKDQLNRKIELDNPVKRIVSLVPSQTELLCDLGLEDEVVGITKFCVHPERWFKSKNRVGGTKDVDIQKVQDLQPDLIIANKEENTKRAINKLSNDFNVYVSDIFTFEDAFSMMSDIGKMTGTEYQAQKIIEKSKQSVQEFPAFDGRILYLIWNDPIMVAGPNTFIGHVIERLGFVNCINDPKERYKALDVNTIKKLDPDYLLLSSEPFPFDNKRGAEISTSTGIPYRLVDGEIFSWYGSRMIKMSNYFQSLKQKFRSNS